MRAYLIDPEVREVREVDYTGDVRQIYTLIGAGPFDTFRVPRIIDGMIALDRLTDFGFVDDEGAIRKPPPPVFLLRGYVHPLFGRCLVLGANEEGESIPPRMTIDDLRRLVIWT